MKNKMFFDKRFTKEDTPYGVTIYDENDNHVYVNDYKGGEKWYIYDNDYPDYPLRVTYNAFKNYYGVDKILWDIENIPSKIKYKGW